jgi:hypothetical protein
MARAIAPRTSRPRSWVSRFRRSAGPGPSSQSSRRTSRIQTPGPGAGTSGTRGADTASPRSKSSPRSRRRHRVRQCSRWRRMAFSESRERLDTCLRRLAEPFVRRPRCRPVHCDVWYGTGEAAQADLPLSYRGVGCSAREREADLEREWKGRWIRHAGRPPPAAGAELRRIGEALWLPGRSIKIFAESGRHPNKHHPEGVHERRCEGSPSWNWRTRTSASSFVGSTDGSLARVCSSPGIPPRPRISRKTRSCGRTRGGTTSDR